MLQSTVVFADATSFGWLSILPPLIAIVLAILTRRVLLSLAIGLMAGTAILSFAKAEASILAHWASTTLEQVLWKNLSDPSHLRVIAFTLMMGVMVTIMQRSGAMDSVVRLMSNVVKGRIGCQLVTWTLGMIVFFDDYANTLLLGGSMRPLADRWGVSREKLAYLVDSTAAPVAGLAVVSTWVAGEIGYIEEGFAALPPEAHGADVSGFSVFVTTIPYRFYVVWALLLVPLTAILRRDLGAMWIAEQKASTTKRMTPPAASHADDISTGSRRAPWPAAVLPVIVVVGVTFWLLVQTGRASLGNAGDTTTQATWFEVVGNGDSYLALFYGSLAGLLSSLILSRLTRSLTLEGVGEAAWTGIRLIVPALAILWLAWSLSEVTDGDHLQTGKYLGQILRGHVSAAWMPSVVFIIAGITAFCTGTSWGTMGILTPLVVPATHQVLLAAGIESTLNDPIMTAAVGSVLAGAIFGDHCSPISDTTVLSSQASGCDHIAHVWTQLPYALLVAAISILFGTIPVGFGVSVWILLPLGLVAMVLALFAFGKPVDVHP